MSINSALLAGVSGLTANSAALSSISDNIANVNTVGYKRVETDFQDIVTSASAQGSYTAGGVLGVTRQLVTQQGDTTQTSSPTDLSLSGQGFFVVTNKAQNNTVTDPRSFTRAGSFTTDSSGYLKNSAGLYLQGWLADPTTGKITTDPSNLSKLQSINISNFGGTASQTTLVSVNANLNSTQPLSSTATASVTNPGAGSGANGAYVVGDLALAAANAAAVPPVTTAPTVVPDYSFQIPISDSEGGQRTIEMDYLKSATPNQWNVEVRVVPPTDVDDTASPNGLIASGVVAFTTDGKLDPVATTLPTSLAFASSTTAPATTALPSGQAQWATALGISQQTISLNLLQPPGGLTQDAAKNVVQSTTTNGTSFGNLTGVNIDSGGFVTAEYDNGVTHQIAQVAVATFPNANELKSISGDAFQVTLQSGAFNLKTAGTGGAGVIAPSTLEASTVDLSSEFTGLIVTQRAYSASSKIITTADQMLQELISIKQ